VEQAGLNPFTRAWKLHDVFRAVHTHLSGGKTRSESTALCMCVVAPMTKTCR